MLEKTNCSIFITCITFDVYDRWRKKRWEVATEKREGVFCIFVMLPCLSVTCGWGYDVGGGWTCLFGWGGTACVGWRKVHGRMKGFGVGFESVLPWEDCLPRYLHSAAEGVMDVVMDAVMDATLDHQRFVCSLIFFNSAPTPTCVTKKNRKDMLFHVMYFKSQIKQTHIFTKWSILRLWTPLWLCNDRILKSSKLYIRCYDLAV